ncbi:hypothetical protein VTK73DRAFT_4886 [Phialemonium thermophilum]|uniref:NADP-dependent oxidoreductase domain-containing protein n=1 Tax=Phialemonium thermophilum TaxID=223376 RepID=A0ABR3WRF7_9PEZI
MEKLLDTGKVRAIGVCNFNIKKLEDLLSKTKVVPAVNQIEAHPYLQQRDLLEFCRAKGILVEAYSPLGNNQVNLPRTVDDPEVQALARDIGLDAGQMLYSWGVQRGTVVLPKSVTPSRIESNLKVKELPAEVFEKLNGLERHKRFNACYHWGADIFDEIGEEEAKKRGREAGPTNLQKFKGV